MAISTDDNRREYQANGTSAVYAFPFPFRGPGNLGVQTYNSSGVQPAVIVPQVLNTDYTISGTQDAFGIYPAGANVIFNSTPNAQTVVTVFRSSAIVSDFLVPQFGAIPGVQLTNELNYLFMLLQRSFDLHERSIRLPDGLPGTFDMALPSNLLQAAGKRIICNSAATGWTMDETLGNFIPNTIVYAVNNSTITSVGGAVDGRVLVSRGSNAPEWAQINASSSATITGILPVVNGGLGVSALTPFSLLYMSSATQVGEVPATAPSAPVGSILTSNGSAAPSFQAFSANNVNSGFVKVEFGGTGQGTLFDGGAVPIIANSGGIFAQTPMLNFSGSSLIIGSTTALGVLQVVGLVAAPARTTAAGVMASGSTALASEVSGVLPILNGGTGHTAFTQHAVVYASSATQLASVPSATAGTVLTANGSSAPSFQSVAVTNNVVSKTSANVSDTSENTLLLSGPSFAQNIWDATNNTGKEVDLIHSGSNFVEVYTIQCSGAQVIRGYGNSVKMHTNGQTLKLRAINSSAFQIANSYAQTGWILAGTNVITGTTTAPRKAVSPKADNIWVQRRGATALVRIEYQHSVVNSSLAGSGDYLWGISPYLNIDTTKITAGTSVIGGGSTLDIPNNVGSFHLGNNTAVVTGAVLVYNSTCVRFGGQSNTGTGGANGSGYIALNNAQFVLCAELELPIAEWLP